MASETRPELSRIVGIFADVHGELRNLTRALAMCREVGAETIALLGDLFDRPEQADACAELLLGWPVVGVWGNHEREIVLGLTDDDVFVRPETAQILGVLREELLIDDILFTHEAAANWGHDDPIARLFGRRNGAGDSEQARITFAGHTHFRSARDQRGPIDISRRLVTLDPVRRYLINPGALAVGQFATWDRETGLITFREIRNS